MGTVDEEVAWLNARIDEMQKRISVIKPPAPVRAPRPPKLRPKRHAETDPDLRALADRAEDLREHLAAARLKNDLASIMKKVDEAVADVNQMHARGEQQEARAAAARVAEAEYAAAARRVEARQESEHWNRVAYDTDLDAPASVSQVAPPPPVTLGAQHELFPPVSSDGGSGAKSSVGVGTEREESPAAMAARIAKETALMTAKVKAFQAKMAGQMSPPSGPISPENAKGSGDIRNFFAASPRKSGDAGSGDDAAEPPAAAAAAQERF